MKIARDQYEGSEGNIKVLETIPILMKYPKYRKKLRGIVLEFLYKEGFSRSNSGVFNK